MTYAISTKNMNKGVFSIVCEKYSFIIIANDDFFRVILLTFFLLFPGSYNKNETFSIYVVNLYASL